MTAALSKVTALGLVEILGHSQWIRKLVYDLTTGFKSAADFLESYAAMEANMIYVCNECGASFEIENARSTEHCTTCGSTNTEELFGFSTVDDIEYITEGYNEEEHINNGSYTDHDDAYEWDNH